MIRKRSVEMTIITFEHNRSVTAFNKSNEKEIDTGNVELSELAVSSKLCDN